MAEENNFSLDKLFGNGDSPTDVSTPEELINQYDNKEEASLNFDQLISNVQMATQPNPALDAYTRGLGAAEMQADRYAGSDRLR